MPHPSDAGLTNAGLTNADRVNADRANPDRANADFSNTNRVNADWPDAGSDTNPEHQRDRSRLLLYLLVAPMVGVGPSLWVVLRRQGDRRLQAVARQSLLLAAVWLVSYGALEWGAVHPDWPTLPLLLASSACTSAYLLSGVWLMVAVWRRRSLRLGPLSTLAAELGPRSKPTDPRGDRNSG